MGANVSSYIRKKGSNPFVDALSRNDAGALTVDLGRVLDAVGVAANSREEVNDLTSALGRGQVSVDDLRGYSRDYNRTTGGDADMSYVNTWSPVSGLTKDALKSAEDAFGIKEKGQQDAARIAQEGRDEARQSNFGAELASANRQAQFASEDAARESAGSEQTPDVVVDSGSDTQSDPQQAGSGEARRRRQAFSGAGLRI